MRKIFAFIILVFELNSFTAKAQTCTGSLGDPIISETFGTGYNVLPAYKTSYPYVGGCPPKNSYTLDHFLFGCGPRSWVQMVGDHTGDPNGNYMLVNAESEPGTVYMDTAKGLCGNTVYQFGVWVTSVMTKFACNGNAVLPNLKFQVTTLSGTVLASGSTGNLPIVDEREWKFYGLSLITPINITDAIVSITINPAYGCGSGFALDDITLRPCGPSISALIDGTPGPAQVCAGYTDPFVVQASYSPGLADPVLQWQSSTDTGRTWQDIPGETALSYTVPHRNSGVILYRAGIAERTNINSLKCRITSNTIYTNINPQPAHVAPQTVYGCLGKEFLFPAADPKALEVLWTGTDGYNSIKPAAPIPIVQYKDTGLYTLKETFYFGCLSLDSFYLKVFPGTTISAKPSYPLCEGASEQLFTSATDTVNYKWTPSTGLSSDDIPNPVATPSDSTNYKVMVTNKYGCKDSAFLQIDVYRNVFADAGRDMTILKGDTLILNGSLKGTAVNFYWTPASFMNNDHLINPAVYPPADGTYTLHVLSTVGCGSTSDEVKIKVYNAFNIPNAFTPNGDGKNEKFEVLMLDNYKLTGLQIYNRYGQVVFSSKGSYEGWDGMFKGEPQPGGVYIYHLEIQTPAGKKISKKGTIVLLR
ncbi:MAG: gliding motility-associated C-terminal domain-containing protein [Ferruginibacter sp.]